jgi:hypothetical protein
MADENSRNIPSPAAAARGKLTVGDSIGGCRIERAVGRGGMGSVYEAYQYSLERKVAVKVLHAAGGSGSCARRRAWPPASTISIVHIHDVGESEVSSTW